MKSRNKIIAGYRREYKFKNKYGLLYLVCLENEICMNSMTISQMQLLEQVQSPSFIDTLIKGTIFYRLFGVVGLMAGTTNAKKNSIYRVSITFTDGEIGVAEVDERIYEKLLDIICQSY